MTNPPPGWLPDPNFPGYVRYWDGTQWTGHAKSAAEPGNDGPLKLPKRQKSAVGSRLDLLTVLGVLCLLLPIILFLVVHYRLGKGADPKIVRSGRQGQTAGPADVRVDVEGCRATNGGFQVVITGTLLNRTDQTQNFTLRVHVTGNLPEDAFGTVDDTAVASLRDVPAGEPIPWNATVNVNTVPPQPPICDPPVIIFET